MAPQAEELFCRTRPSPIDIDTYSRVHSLPLVEDGPEVCPRVGACDRCRFALGKAQRAQAESARYEPAEVMLLCVEDVADVLDRGPVAVRRPGSECRPLEAFQQRTKPGRMFGHGCEGLGRTDLFHIYLEITERAGETIPRQ